MTSESGAGQALFAADRSTVAADAVGAAATGDAADSSVSMRRWLKGRDPGRPAVGAVTALSAAVAAVAVLRHLGTKPLWRDEAISLSVASRPVARILSVLPHHDANAGFYYLVLHSWLRIGHSPAATRGLSAACFIATAALAAWAATKWRGWETGLACGLLVALNPFLVYYGQEARPYALAALLGAASTVALFWHGRQPAPRVYLATTIALIYSDLFAVLYVGAMAGALMALYRLRGLPVPPVLKRCWWIIACAAAPLAALMMIFERGQISWIGRPNLRVLSSTLTSMSAGWLGLELVVVLAAAGIISVRPSAVGAQDRGIVAALAAAFVLPPLTLWSFSQLIPSFIDRYVICSTLAMVALAAAGLSAMGRPSAGARRVGGAGAVVPLAILAALLLVSGQRTARLEAQPFKVDNAPALVDFILVQTRAGDAVAYAGGGLRILVEASRSRGGRGAFPPDIALATGGEGFRQHDLYAREVDAAELSSRLAAVQRLWMITDPMDRGYPQGGPFAELKTTVMAAFAAGSTTSFGATDVTLLVRR